MVSTMRSASHDDQSNATNFNPPSATNPSTIEQVLTTQTQLLQTLVHHVVNNQQQAPPINKRGEFMMGNPPTFSHASVPLEADDWLRAVEKQLNIAQCDDQQKVLYASGQLQGAAQTWWESYQAARPDNAPAITWQEFVKDFKAHHILDGLIEVKQEEFRSLKMGSMTASKYHDKFVQLSRYAPNEVREDADKQRLFLKGIYYDLRLQLLGNTYPNFQALANRAIVLDNIRKVHDKKRRKMQHQSIGSNTCLGFAAQPTYQSHSVNLSSTDLDQYQFQQPNDEVQHFTSQEPWLPPPTITLMESTTTTSEEGYDCGGIEHYENECARKLTESNHIQNQQQQEAQQDVHNKQEQENKLERKYIPGRLNNVDMITIHGAKEVVYGFIGVSSNTAMVLFDRRASHSFISRKYVEDHKMAMLPIRKPIIVNFPEGEKKADRICPKVSLDIKGVKFVVNLIVLESVEIDVILGNGWLTACKGVINYAQRSVLLRTPSRERIEYVGIQPAPEDDDLFEGVNTDDSKVDIEFSDMGEEKQTGLEELKTGDGHVFVD